jgi:hypothetical protein
MKLEDRTRVVEYYIGGCRYQYLVSDKTYNDKNKMAKMGLRKVHETKQVRTNRKEQV